LETELLTRGRAGVIGLTGGGVDTAAVDTKRLFVYFGIIME